MSNKNSFKERATLGFSGGKERRPKSLMRGYELSEKAVKPDILSRRKGEEEFDNIVVGNEKIVYKFLESFDDSFNVNF